MGLFGSKKKTYRDLSYSRLIEDDYLPDVIGQAITTYVLDEDNTTSLADLMIEYGWKSNAVKWNAAYRWASKPGKYAYGIPGASIVNQTDFTGAASLNEVLESLTGQTNLNYVYSKFGSINMRHAMWQLLISQYSYNATTNQLNGLNTSLGATAYLYSAKSFFNAQVWLLADPFTLEHWGFSPESGATQNRAQNLAAADVADGTAIGEENYTRVEYTFRFTGLTQTDVVTNMEVETTVRTPNESGGYDDETTTTSSDSTTTTTDDNGQTLPPASNIISQDKTVTDTTTNTETDDPTTTTTTDPDTGVITIVKTTVSRKTTVTTSSNDVVAFFNMGFGQYDYSSDLFVDTTTVLDDNDMNNYDPNAVLDPSGESVGGDDDYFQVLFTYDVGSTTNIGYFTYQYGSGNYPDLDGISDTTVTDFGKSYPRMYFRLNGNKLSDSRYVDTAAYKTSIKFGKKLDMDWLEILGKIYDSLSSLSKIRDVLMIQCVPANTSNKLEQEYLFRYFKTLYGIRPVITDSNIGTTTVMGDGGGSSTRPTTDYDTYAAHAGTTMKSTDGTINVYNSMDAIGWRSITGTIGPVGTVASGRGTGTKLVIYKRTTSDDRGKTSTQTTYGTANTSYHYYRMQISDTVYEEVRVFELSHKVDVGGKGVGRSGDSNELMVPLDYAFRKEFSPHERETLYARATHILICTEYTVKTKWYQSGVFKAVVVVIAVVLSWWTGGASLTLVGAVTAAASAIGAMVVMSLLSKYVFSKLGGVFAIIATVVAIAVAIYTGYLYLSSTTGPFSITATQMMQVSNVAFQAAQSAQQGVIAKEMQKIATLEEEIADKQEALEVAQKELANPYNTIEDGVFLKAIQGYAYLGEKPQEYFARTLNTNIGVETNNLVEMYYSQSTELPSDVAINQLILQNIQRPFELFNELSNLINQ